MIGSIRSRLVRGGMGLLVLAVALQGCLPFQTGNGPSPTAPPRISKVSALGRLEPSEGVIAITAAPGEQVLEVLVPVQSGETGDRHVKKDQELVILKSKEMRVKEQE